jgi:hypothetical protein
MSALAPASLATGDVPPGRTDVVGGHSWAAEDFTVDWCLPASWESPPEGPETASRRRTMTGSEAKVDPLYQFATE